LANIISERYLSAKADFGLLILASSLGGYNKAQNCVINDNVQRTRNIIYFVPINMYICITIYNKPLHLQDTRITRLRDGGVLLVTTPVTTPLDTRLLSLQIVDQLITLTWGIVDDN